eukprot:GHVL01035367.1.p1 GENE.GHVL01035367.1~~GHVL01035367.1.p1  ORF type:complete len:736 (+),score=67.25 GHVL01035367.1:2186-4393(+)
MEITNMIFLLYSNSLAFWFITVPIYILYFILSVRYIKETHKSLRPFMFVFLVNSHILAFIGLLMLINHERRWRLFLEVMILYQLSGLGITAGAHRLWSHRAYKASIPARIILMILNCFANQGSIYHWSRDHRLHHMNSETPADPHNAKLGFFYSHMGWLLLKKPKEVKEAGIKTDMSDLKKDPVVMFQKNFDPWLSQFLCFVLPGLYTLEVYGNFVLGFLVIGYFRWLIELHATWCVNSVAHLYGTRPYDPLINPVESLFVSLVATGEGYHNWHHTYPRDYAAGEMGWTRSWNPAKFFIDLLALAGLVTDRYRSDKEWALAKPRITALIHKMKIEDEEANNARSPLDASNTIEEFNKNGGVFPQPATIHNAIPEKCKERSALKSSWYIVRDMIICAGIFYLANITVPHHWAAKIIHLFIYSALMGTAATGLWVIGHECGHEAFSSDTYVNNVVGFVLHSALLVPYFSWKYTHAKHHRFTNHLLDGESHVPATVKFSNFQKKLYTNLGEDGFVIFDLFAHLLFGWPAYLFFNISGGRRDWKGNKIDRNGVVDHFRGVKENQIFPPNMRIFVNLSSFGVLTMIGLLVKWGFMCGWMTPLKWYICPYLVVNLWLVLYTWLQHTHPDIPHYGEESFTFMRGALSTVDRKYPFLIDEMHHHIGSTHVLHHIDSKIPHYHAQEATLAIKEVLGTFYRHEPKGIFRSLLETSRTCHYVNAIEGVQFYQNVPSLLKKSALKQQ